MDRVQREDDIERTHWSQNTPDTWDQRYVEPTLMDQKLGKLGKTTPKVRRPPKIRLLVWL